MRLGFSKVLLAVIVVIAIIVIALWALSGVPTVSTSTTASIAKNSSFNFYIPTDANVSSIYIEQSTSSSAVIYMGKRPLLLNNLMIIHLSTGQAANVSLGGSGNADVGITLVSSNPNSATLAITYIPQDFGVKQSPGIQIIRAGNIGGQATTSLTTTIGSSNGTTSVTTVVGQTTTVAATTTVKAVNETAQALIGANSTYIGVLANNFKAIFIRESTTCTQGIYDNEFAAEESMVPTGPNTYANTTVEVPDSMTSSAKEVSTGIYNITYTEVVPAGNRVFAIMSYNLSSDNIINSVFKGDFGTTYNEALQSYQAINTSDKCSVYGV